MFRPTTVVTVYSREKTGENAANQPQYDKVKIHEDVPCEFRDSQSSFSIVDTGEKVEYPATATFNGRIDVSEGDVVKVPGSGYYEVTGIEYERSNIERGRIRKTRCNLEEADGWTPN